jgi:DUF1680 family protein
MLQSNACILHGMTPEARFYAGECRNDYGGWESPTSLLRGHITGGHFLSAAAQMVNATGDAGLKATLAYMVGELAACQTANAALFGAGYLGAYPCVPLDRASASPAARPTHPGP